MTIVLLRISRGEADIVPHHEPAHSFLVTQEAGSIIKGRPSLGNHPVSLWRTYIGVGVKLEVGVKGWD